MAVKAAYDEGELGIYADNLEDLDARDLAEAFAAAERTCRGGFLPSPGELRDMAETAAQLRLEVARRQAEQEEREKREAEKQRLIESGEAMTLRDFVDQLRQDRPDLVRLASRVVDPDKLGPISTESDEAAEIRRDRAQRAFHIQQAVEFFCELKARARKEGISLKPLEVGR